MNLLDERSQAMSFAASLLGALAERGSGADGRGGVPWLRAERLSGLPAVPTGDDCGANRVNVVLCLCSPRCTAVASQYVFLYARQIWFLNHPQTVSFQIVI